MIAEEDRTGIEGGLTAIRRFMEITAGYAPLRRFAESEPGPALRVLMAVDGAVAQALREGSTRAMLGAIPEPIAPEPELTEVLVQLGTALEWAPIVAGEEPAIDRAIDLMRTVLSAHAADLSAARRRQVNPCLSWRVRSRSPSRTNASIARSGSSW